jgi:hypothetical protein
MKKLLLLLIVPLLMFGQKELKLRKSEKIIMDDLWTLLRPVYGKGKLLIQPGNAYLTNERFYFTTIKKAMGTKHFVKSFDYNEIRYVRKTTYEKRGEKKFGYKIILKNGEKHTCIMSRLRFRRKWIEQLRQNITK